MGEGRALIGTWTAAFTGMCLGALLSAALLVAIDRATPSVRLESHGNHGGSRPSGDRGGLPVTDLAEKVPLEHEADEAIPQVAKTEGRRKAEALYDAESRSGSHPEGIRAVVGYYDELDDNSAEFFIDRYLRAEGERKFDLHALRLAFLSGGAPVADLIRQRLAHPGAWQEESVKFKLAIGGVLEDGYPIAKLPMDAELEGMAWSALRSADPIDQVAAAGLLGHVDTPASREALSRLVASHSDRSVQAAAALALARIGGNAEWSQLFETINRFRTIHTGSRDDERCFQALGTAIAKLGRKLGRP